jgi:hypothetical protein
MFMVMLYTENLNILIPRSGFIFDTTTPSELNTLIELPTPAQNFTIPRKLARNIHPRAQRQVTDAFHTSFYRNRIRQLVALCLIIFFVFFGLLLNPFSLLAFA